MEEVTFSVYCHTFVNNKKYIGYTKNIKERWGSNGDGYKRHPYLWNAIKKYGWGNTKHEIIAEKLTLEEAKQLEIDLIAKYRTNERDYGYNLTNGGDGTVGYKHTEHSKIKMSKARKGKHLSEEHKQNISKSLTGENSPRYGKHHTEEAKQKNSEAHKGKHLQEEHKQKISKTLKINPPFKGKHHTEEAKQKNSEAHKGIHLSQVTRNKLSKVIEGRRWWNNGIIEIRSYECPDGFTKGRLKKTK